MTITQVRDAIYNWINNVLPANDIITVIASQDIEAGSGTVVTINGVALASVPFNADHATTMQDIATAIENESDISSAEVLGSDLDERTIEIIALAETDVIIDSIVTTGGAQNPTWSIDREAYENRITWVNQQDAPEPVIPYIALDLNSFVQVGQAYNQPQDSQGTSIILINKEATLSVQAYDTNNINAMEKVTDIANSVNIESIKSLLCNSGIAAFQVLGLQDITFLVGKQFYGRANVDIRIRFAETISDSSLGWIESVEGEGEILGGKSTQTITVDVDK